MGKAVKGYSLLVDGGIRTHDPETHGLSTAPFVMELERIGPFQHWQKLNIH